jgi:hypothetical protein
VNLAFFLGRGATDPDAQPRRKTVTSGFQQKYIWLSKVIRERVEATPLHAFYLKVEARSIRYQRVSHGVWADIDRPSAFRYDLCEQKAPNYSSADKQSINQHRRDIVMKTFSTTFLAIAIALCFTASVRADFPTAVDRDAESRLATAPPARIMSKAPQLSDKPQADKDATETGTNHMPGFLFLIGFGLIGLRLLVSYQRKKVKSLAPQSH